MLIIAQHCTEWLLFGKLCVGIITSDLCKADMALQTPHWINYGSRLLPGQQLFIPDIPTLGNLLSSQEFYKPTDKRQKCQQKTYLNSQPFTISVFPPYSNFWAWTGFYTTQLHNNLSVNH